MAQLQFAHDTERARQILVRLTDENIQRLTAKIEEFDSKLRDKAEQVLNLLSFDHSPRGEMMRRHYSKCRAELRSAVEMCRKIRRGRHRGEVEKRHTGIASAAHPSPTGGSILDFGFSILDSGRTEPASACGAAVRVEEKPAGAYATSAEGPTGIASATPSPTGIASATPSPTGGSILDFGFSILDSGRTEPGPAWGAAVRVEEKPAGAYATSAEGPTGIASATPSPTGIASATPSPTGIAISDFGFSILDSGRTEPGAACGAAVRVEEKPAGAYATSAEGTTGIASATPGPTGIASATPSPTGIAIATPSTTGIASATRVAAAPLQRGGGIRSGGCRSRKNAKAAGNENGEAEARTHACAGTGSEPGRSCSDGGDDQAALRHITRRGRILPFVPSASSGWLVVVCSLLQEELVESEKRSNMTAILSETENRGDVLESSRMLDVCCQLHRAQAVACGGWPFLHRGAGRGPVRNLRAEVDLLPRLADHSLPRGARRHFVREGSRPRSWFTGGQSRCEGATRSLDVRVGRAGAPAGMEYYLDLANADGQAVEVRRGMGRGRSAAHAVSPPAGATATAGACAGRIDRAVTWVRQCD